MRLGLRQICAGYFPRCLGPVTPESWRRRQPSLKLGESRRRMGSFCSGSTPHDFNFVAGEGVVIESNYHDQGPARAQKKMFFDEAAVLAVLGNDFFPISLQHES